MTFSVVARCPRTGALGMAISSSSPAVASRCAHARAGVGVVATQNVTDPRLGPQGLELMAAGHAAQAALDRLRASAPHVEYRQLALVDRAGGSAVFSGAHTLGRHIALAVADAAAAGNLLADAAVPEQMLAALFARPGDDLADRLLAALQAGLRAGGEEGPVHSAGMMVVRDVAWPIVDLRIDWHDDDPIAALARAWEVYKPQRDDYIQRALDPSAAPGYGVPGEK